MLAILCSALERAHGRDARAPAARPRRIDWPEPDGTDFHQPHGERIALLRDTGFEIEALHELYAPEGHAEEVRYYMQRGWAQQWPCEEVWVARRS